MYIVGLILVLIPILIILYCVLNNNYEKFCNPNMFANYSNQVFQVRPPNCTGYQHKPYDTIYPTFNYKTNFLPYPMEGFTNPGHDVEGFTNANNVEGFDIEKWNPFNKKLKMESGIPFLENEDRPKAEEILEQIKREMKQKEKGLNAKIQTQISQNIEKPVYQQPMQDMKFFSSANCANGYEPTGAQFSFIGEGDFMCNNDQTQFQSAKAVASIENGRIKAIHLLNKGKGYQKTPRIRIIGGGMAKAKAMIDGEGKIQIIDVLNAGEGFQNTPQIEIQKPNLSRTCYLCRKK